MFFTANDGEHGRRAVASDGTPPAPCLVRDIILVGTGSYPLDLTTSAARSSSPPTTELTAASCGRATARRRHRPRQGHRPRRDYHGALDGLAPMSTASCSSPPTTAVAAASCGRATAPPPAPFSVKDITRRRRIATPSERPSATVVLHRRRRHPRPGAVEVGRHHGGHRPGQGHQPRRRRLANGPVLPDRLWAARCSSPPTTAPRPGAVEVRRHQGRHRPGQGHQPRPLRLRQLRPYH